jgi:DNA ligase-1
MDYDIKYQERLFKVHSNGEVGDWQIMVATKDATVVMQRKSRKKLDGKAVLTPTYFMEGKNIGRANETTPLEQAILEAKSKVSKQLDKGYVIDRPEAGAAVTNTLGFKKPMLATAIDKVKAWQFPVYASRKFDGHRMLATVVDGAVVLYSRGGKKVDVAHICDILQRAYEAYLLGNYGWDGTTIDGEVYLHGATLQRISSLVKKPKIESRTLTYNIYDAINPDRDYEDRLNYIRSMTVDLDHDFVRCTDTVKVENQADLDALHSKFLSEGYEGTMVRHGDTGYEDGKRSKSLMKMKDFQDAEFEIIGYTEGKPYIREMATYQVPIYRCRADNGSTFDCTAPGTMEEKHALWMSRDTDVGQLLTVKFFNLTPDGLPFLPVALRMREDI